MAGKMGKEAVSSRLGLRKGVGVDTFADIEERGLYPYAERDTAEILRWRVHVELASVLPAC